METVDWGAFAGAAPELAAAGQERLDGRVAYLGTIRKDGAPRIHPVTPIISEAGVYVFMEATSPKGHDLRRDSRFTLHAGVEDNNGGGGEFVISGEARLVSDGAERQRAIAASSYPPAARYLLFTLTVSEALHTVYDGEAPSRTRWASG